jgi:hypothetical protein
MTEMRQFVPASGRFIGEPPNTDKDYVAWCPKCRRRLPEGKCEGYGLAGGGGCGHYIYCNNPKCDWFYKWLDADETGGEHGLNKPGTDGSRG